MEITPDLLETKHCHCLAARKKAREITRLYDEALRPHGLRSTQFSVLASLSLKGPTPIGALATLLGLERTTLTRGVAVLGRRGWVEAEVAKDARQRRLRLTAAGHEKLQEALPAWKRAQDLVGGIERSIVSSGESG